jgi:hypothetical protein
MAKTVETSLDPYEIDGNERKGLPNEADALIVKAHRIFNYFAILDWRGHSITVSIADLERALRNAGNH